MAAIKNGEVNRGRRCAILNPSMSERPFSVRKHLVPTETLYSVNKRTQRAVEVDERAFHTREAKIAEIHDRLPGRENRSGLPMPRPDQFASASPNRRKREVYQASERDRAAHLRGELAAPADKYLDHPLPKPVLSSTKAESPWRPLAEAEPMWSSARPDIFLGDPNEWSDRTRQREADFLKDAVSDRRFDSSLDALNELDELASKLSSHRAAAEEGALSPGVRRRDRPVRDRVNPLFAEANELKRRDYARYRESLAREREIKGDTKTPPVFRSLALDAETRARDEARKKERMEDAWEGHRLDAYLNRFDKTLTNEEKEASLEKDRIAIKRRFPNLEPSPEAEHASRRLVQAYAYEDTRAAAKKRGRYPARKPIVPFRDGRHELAEDEGKAFGGGGSDTAQQNRFDAAESELDQALGLMDAMGRSNETMMNEKAIEDLYWAQRDQENLYNEGKTQAEQYIFDKANDHTVPWSPYKADAAGRIGEYEIPNPDNSAVAGRHGFDPLSDPRPWETAALRGEEEDTSHWSVRDIKESADEWLKNRETLPEDTPGLYVPRRRGSALDDVSPFAD